MTAPWIRCGLGAVVIALSTVSMVASTGCSDVSAPLPAGVSDPNALATEGGAREIYQGAVNAFISLSSGQLTNGQVTSITNGAFLDAVLFGGLLGDELQRAALGGPRAAYLNGSFAGAFAVDARQLPENIANEGEDGYLRVYSQLQEVRGRASQGIGALAAYAPRDSALRGHLYALEGYAEVLLADIFCSGVPLSTLDYNGDYTLQPGSPTRVVYRHAIALFDTAIALSGDSARFLNLARVGKSRAHLALAEYDSAALLAHEIPVDFVYQFNVDWTGGFGPGSLLAGLTSPGTHGIGLSVSDTEGMNGLAYRSGHDPRTAAVPFYQHVSGTTDSLLTPNVFGDTIYIPVKFGVPTTTSPLTVASWTEAQLALAEAAAHGVAVAEGSSIEILNALRQREYAGVLPLLPNDLTGDALIDTVFAERAKWLFLTGQRQGDLRRLVREYHRPQNSVYPTGSYPALYNSFGTDINAPVPAAEKLNPHFTGCLSRDT